LTKAALPTPNASTCRGRVRSPEEAGTNGHREGWHIEGTRAIVPIPSAELGRQSHDRRRPPGSPCPTDPLETWILWRAHHLSTSSTISTGAWSPSPSRTATTRSHLGRRYRTSPGLQVGRLVLTSGGTTGLPSVVSSLKTNAILSINTDASPPELLRRTPHPGHVFNDQRGGNRLTNVDQD
jgi:hypothetical protein